MEKSRVTLTAGEAADYLGISYWLLLKMCKQKELPHIRAGSRVLFRKETLDLWLRNRESASTQVTETSTSYGKLRKLEV